MNRAVVASYLSLFLTVVVSSSAIGQRITSVTDEDIARGSPPLERGEYRVVANISSGELYMAVGKGSGTEYHELGGNRRVRAKTVAIEAGFFSMQPGRPKVGYLDSSMDPYKRLYGTLVHPIRTDNAEFIPNVVVTQVRRDHTPTTDLLTYLPLVEPMAIDFPGHNLNGTIYVGEQGQLTNQPRNGHRKIRVGETIDPNRVVLYPAFTTVTSSPPVLSFNDVTVWNKFPAHAYRIIRTQPEESVQIWTNNQPTNEAPSSDDLITALAAANNTDEVRIQPNNRGLDIELKTESYVSDLWLRLARLPFWAEDNQLGQRRSFSVLVFGSDSATAPVKFKIWDRDDGPIRYPNYNLQVRINQVVQRIQLNWSSSQGSIQRQGSIVGLRLFGAPRRESIQVTPGSATISYDRWEIAPREKLIKMSERMDPYTVQRTGIGRNVTEVYHRDLFGMNQSYNPKYGQVYDPRHMDVRAYRDYVQRADYYLDREFVSLDFEAVPWIYHPRDNLNALTQKNRRWRSAFAAVRGITPHKFVGPYTHPHRSMPAILNFQHGIDPTGPGYFRNAVLREENADLIYQLSDYMAPTVYANSLKTGGQIRPVPIERWKTLVEWMRDECHDRGKLFIPHFSGYDYVRQAAIPNVEAYLDFLLTTADGIMLWDSSQASPYTESEKRRYSQAIRNAIRKAEQTSTRTKHLNVPGGNPIPNVDGCASVRIASDIPTTGFIGGIDGQLLWVEIPPGGSLVAASGTIDFGANGPSSPFQPPAGGSVLLRRDKGAWKFLANGNAVNSSATIRSIPQLHTVTRENSSPTDTMLSFRVFNIGSGEQAIANNKPFLFNAADFLQNPTGYRLEDVLLKADGDVGSIRFPKDGNVTLRIKVSWAGGHQQDARSYLGEHRTHDGKLKRRYAPLGLKNSTIPSTTVVTVPNISVNVGDHFTLLAGHSAESHDYEGTKINFAATEVVAFYSD